MPVADCFVDTNVLLYAISTDPTESQKTARAQRLLTQANWAWSAQIAAEFMNASTSARRAKPLSLQAAEVWIDSWSAFPMVSLDRHIVKHAIRVAKQFGISYFDAQVIAAAKAAGVSVMYSEDLNDGQDYDGVKVMNPF
jgi:predicted nucleic acid-binding protein